MRCLPNSYLLQHQIFGCDFVSLHKKVFTALLVRFKPFCLPFLSRSKIWCFVTKEFCNHLISPYHADVRIICRVFTHDNFWATSSVVERVTDNDEVEGSIPSSPIFNIQDVQTVRELQKVIPWACRRVTFLFMYVGLRQAQAIKS